MKKLLIAAATLATIVAPMAASAQSQGEVRHDRRELRQDQRDAHRNGDVNRNERREIQGDRRELQSDRRDMRADRWDRNNRTWWRGRREFSGYTGRRAGYWYAPGYGYRQVDRRYVGYNWRRGGFVPAGYRNYYVPSSYYGFYGLRAAPYGQRWVYLDGNLALISLSSGLIGDMIYNAY